MARIFSHDGLEMLEDEVLKNALQLEGADFEGVLVAWDAILLV